MKRPLVIFGVPLVVPQVHVIKGRLIMKLISIDTCLLPIGTSQQRPHLDLQLSEIPVS